LRIHARASAAALALAEGDPADLPDHNEINPTIESTVASPAYGLERCLKRLPKTVSEGEVPEKDMLSVG
jgi:hypothetical protein